MSRLYQPAEPTGWKTSSVGEVFRVVGGGTPSTQQPNFWRGSIPWITSADVEEGRVYPKKMISQEAIAASATNLIPAGSVVVVTRVGLGKVGIAESDLCFSQDCQGLLFDRSDLEPRFVLHQMSRAVAEFKVIGRGTTINGVTKNQLLDTPFIIAPRQEQRRIVEAIESYFTRLDAAVATLERVKANLKRYRASVLKAAIEGRLVPTEAELARKEGRDYEPASVLVERILKERRRRWEEAELAKLKAAGKTPKDVGWKAKYEEPVAPEQSKLPELPEGWCWASLDQLTADSSIGLDRGLQYQKTTPPGSPYIKMNNVTMDGRLLLNDLVFVETTKEEQERYALLESDLLFNTRNSKELVGKVGIVKQVPAIAVYNNNLMRLRIDGAVLPAFVCLQMCSSGFRTRMEAVKRATTSVAAVYAKDLFPLPVALPPLTEQEVIVEVLEDQLSVIEHLEANLQSKLKSAQALRQAILRHAFTGQLVPQDPTDEPASVLLDRIKAEREKASDANQTQSRPRGKRKRTA